MIIRSQDKKTIVNFGEGCALEAMQGDNWIGVAFIHVSGESTDLGFYNSIEDAIAVINEIFGAFGNWDKYNMPPKDRKNVEEPL